MSYFYAFLNVLLSRGLAPTFQRAHCFHIWHWYIKKHAYPDDGSNIFRWGSGVHLSDNTTSQTRRPQREFSKPFSTSTTHRHIEVRRHTSSLLLNFETKQAGVLRVSGRSYFGYTSDKYFELFTNNDFEIKYKDRQVCLGLHCNMGHAVPLLVEALRYMSEGRGFDSR